MRFRVIALHPTNICNYNCSFCYKKLMKNKEKEPDSMWFKLPKYLKEITPQVAVGGGEIFLFPEWIKKFGKECKKNDLVFNITTNGKCNYEEMDDEVFKNITMVSISYDKEKIRSKKDLKRYFSLVQFFHSKHVLVGCNLLVDERMFRGNFIKFIASFFKQGFDRVYCLYPKIIKGPDILKHKFEYALLTSLFKHFYVDDLTLMILSQGFKNWKSSCHYGKDACSIDEEFYVTGCSFDDRSKSVLKIEEPRDVLKLERVNFEDRFKCPYLKY